MDSPPTYSDVNGNRVLNVSLFLNGDFETSGTPMTANGSSSLQEFLQAAGDTLEITALGINLVRAFTGAGVELFTLDSLNNGDRVYLSAGENFLFNEAVYQEEPAAAVSSVPGVYATHAPPQGGRVVPAVDPRDPNYRPGPLENAATNAATFVQYAYGLASNILMFTHPRIGVTMNQVKDVVHNNYSENIAYHEQQVLGKLRKADVAVEKVVQKIQERKGVYLQSLNGQTLQKTLDEVSGSIKTTVTVAASNFNSSKNGVPEGMDANEFYAHAQAAYGSNGTGDFDSFVGKLASKAGLFWHDKLQPQAKQLYEHFKDLKGGLQVATAAVTARIAGGNNTPANPYGAVTQQQGYVPLPQSDGAVSSGNVVVSPSNNSVPVAYATNATSPHYSPTGPYGANRGVYAGGSPSPMHQQARQTTVEIVEEPKQQAEATEAYPNLAQNDHMLD